MRMRISTFRSKLAACAASVALATALLAAPAAAETERKRWLPNHDPAAHSGNVEQRGRQVNRRNDDYDRGKPPAWFKRPGEQGREKSRKHRREAQTHTPMPPVHNQRDRRHDGRRHGNVEQASREVNRRHGGQSRGTPPAWFKWPGEQGREKGRKHKREAQTHTQMPPVHNHRDRSHDGRRHGHTTNNYYYSYGGGHDHRKHRHAYRKSPRSYSYSFYFVQPYSYMPVHPAPYHGHGHGAQYDHADACAGVYSDGGRYVMGGSHQLGGTILGGIVGAAIGSQVGGGKGRLAAVGVGTLIGALIGQDIGRSMDAADCAYATGSFGYAMEYAPSCSRITWSNPGSGSSGTVTPTHTYKPEPGRYCREFQQQVVIGGQVQDAYGTACRQPDGSWEIVAEQP